VRELRLDASLRVAAAVGIIITIALAAVVVADPMAPARFLAPSDPLRRADAVLVFSGDPEYERTLEAVRVYRAGYAPYLVFSGQGGPGDSAQSMAEVAHRSGVPGSAILLEPRARSTYENVAFVRDLLARHHVRTLILVTSPYHERRAYLVARHVLRDVALVNHPVPHSSWSPEGWWWTPGGRQTVVDEYAKLGAYFVTGRL
jgi:uncharacterized SAM-binding protein YcdF (DUF218 family)